MCLFTEEGTNRGGIVKSVRISNTGEDSVIRGRMNCNTSNLLYIITGRKCDRTSPDVAQYGGETGKEAVKSSRYFERQSTDLLKTLRSQGPFWISRAHLSKLRLKH